MINLKPIEETKTEKTTNKNLVPIEEPVIQPKPGEKNIQNLPEWNIEPPVEINRGK